MSEYDSNKDTVLQEFSHDDGLTVKIVQYGNDDPKIKIGPRIVNGKPVRVGRLSKDEAKWTGNILINCAG